MPVKKTANNAELKVMLQAALDELAVIRHEQTEAKTREAKREHLDALVMSHEEAMHDNGKVGLKTIRNEWIGLKGKWNTIVVALILEMILIAIK